MHELHHELHLHLYGCLTAEDVFELGRDRYRHVPERLAWFVSEYEKAYGRRPDPTAYWEKDDGFERLRQDFEFREPGPFEQFQARFNLLIALFPFSPSDTSVLRVALERAPRQGLSYAEYRVFLPPMLDEGPLDEALANLTACCEAFEGASFTPRLALTLPRDPANAERLYRLIRAWSRARRERSRFLVGFDFCGSEVGHPPKELAPLLKRIRADNEEDPAHGFAVLYHVGESFDHLAPMSAVRWIAEAWEAGAHRLGHAIALGLAPSAWNREVAVETVEESRDHLMWLLRMAPTLADHGFAIDAKEVERKLSELSSKPLEASVSYELDDDYLSRWEHLQDAVSSWLVTRDAIVESCPTSNFRIGRIDDPAAHPLPRFLGEGLRTVVSTDDPGIFAVTLRDEEELCRELFGLRTEDLRRLEQEASRSRAKILAGRVSCN